MFRPPGPEMIMLRTTRPNDKCSRLFSILENYVSTGLISSGYVSTYLTQNDYLLTKSTQSDYVSNNSAQVDYALTDTTTQSFDQLGLKYLYFDRLDPK